MSLSFERIQLLMRQSRYRQAEQEVREALFQAPDQAVLHALLALCLIEQEQPEQALAAAHTATALDPESAWYYYVLASVWDQLGRFKEAHAALQEALTRNPADADCFALLANLYFQESRWPEALQSAEQALSLAPDHLMAANLRSMALVRLGKGPQALEGLTVALHQQPDYALTHASRGWALLEQGQHQAALEAFKEALALDPQEDWAREGLVEALKARHLLYRLMLKYFFLIGRLRRGQRLLAMLGVLVVFRVLRSLFPPTQFPWLGGLVITVYLGFVWLTWLAEPLFNLLLRLNRYGRLALTPAQIQASNWLAGLSVGGTLTGVAGLGLRSWQLLAGGVLTLMMTIPVTTLCQLPASRQRRRLEGYTLGLATLGTGGILALSLAQTGLALGLLGLFLLGWVGFSWLVNLVNWRAERR
jgi:tetratricopeptide (TPR) repeat protein